jgi:hypothetical protein
VDLDASKGSAFAEQLHMAGLSKDPAKKKAQLDVLRRGREELARRTLEATAPAGEPGSLAVPVHSYGEPPTPPPINPPDADPVPVAEQETDAQAAQRRRGPGARFLDAFAKGQ